MVEIDTIDRNILYCLFIDARQSYQTIGKKVNLHRNNVKYRVDNLIKKGIITKFYPVINTFNLGYNVIRVYIKLQEADKDLRSSLLKYLCDDPNTWYIDTISGNYDISIALWVRNMNHFHVFWDELLRRYRQNIQHHTVALFLSIFYYKPFWLYNHQNHIQSKKSSIHLDNSIVFDVSESGKRLKIDEESHKILELLTKNSRIPSSEIAREIGISSQKVVYRIKQMKETGIIEGFTIDIDFSKINLMCTKANINLIDYSKRGNIVNYLKNEKHLHYISKQAGFVDLEVGFIIQNFNEFMRIMDDLEYNFPHTIKNYNYFHGWKINKVIYIPNINI